MQCEGWQRWSNRSSAEADRAALPGYNDDLPGYNDDLPGYNDDQGAISALATERLLTNGAAHGQLQVRRSTGAVSVGDGCVRSNSRCFDRWAWLVVHFDILRKEEVYLMAHCLMVLSKHNVLGTTRHGSVLSPTKSTKHGSLQHSPRI